jgi:hypothetical protein
MHGGAWFWFPERRLGLVYLDEPASRGSYLFRTVQPGSGSWVIQLARPGARALCYDALNPDPLQVFTLRSDEAAEWRLNADLVPKPGDQPGVLAVAPPEWDQATLAWLTADGGSGPLNLRRLSRTDVHDPHRITIDDIDASPFDLSDASLAFALHDHIGPAIKPKMITAESRVLATFPPFLPEGTALTIELRLFESVHSRVPIQILQRHVQGGRLKVVDNQILTPKRPGAAVTLRQAPAGLEVYVQTPEGVGLWYRDGSGPASDADGGQLARLRRIDGLSPASPNLIDHHREDLDAERERLRADGGGSATGGAAREATRTLLLTQRDLAALLEDTRTAALFHELPAPLVAALLDSVDGMPGDRLVATRRFLESPSASQLHAALGVVSDDTVRQNQDEDAATALWKRNGVDGEGFSWLARDPRRQLELLSLIKARIDVSSTITSLRHLPHLPPDDLRQTALDLLEIAKPIWPRLVSLLFPGRALHRRGTGLLGECATAAESSNVVHSRRQRLTAFAGDVGTHLVNLSEARRRCGAYSEQVSYASTVFNRSIEDGLVEIERLTNEYGASGETESDAAAALVRELETGVAAEFLFDERALAAIARDRLQQAQVVEWLGKIIDLLDRRLDSADLPPWPDRPQLDELAFGIGRVNQYLSRPAPVEAQERMPANLPPSLRPEAERLRAELEANLEKCRRVLFDWAGRKLKPEFHARLAWMRERVVFLCLCGALRCRQRALLDRHKALGALAFQQLDASARGAVDRSRSDSAPEDLDAWSDALVRLEGELNKGEALVSQVREQVRDFAEPSAEPPILEPAQLEEQAKALIARWRDEVGSAGNRFVRTRLYAEAMEVPWSRASEANTPEPVAAEDGAKLLEAFPAWHRYHSQRLTALNAALLEFGRAAASFLTRRCPAVSWGDQAGRQLAEALIELEEREPAEVIATLAKALGRLDEAWRLSGGGDPDNVRNLIWLGHDEPNVRRIEAVLGAIKNPERLLTDFALHQDLANVEAIDPTPPHQRPDHLRGFAEFRAFLGRLALERLHHLHADLGTAPALAAVAERTQAHNFWDAIAEVSGLLADGSGPGREAETLRSGLARNKLWPPHAEHEPS